jgi:hypothetical protein
VANKKTVTSAQYISLKGGAFSGISNDPKPRA